MFYSPFNKYTFLFLKYFYIMGRGIKVKGESNFVPIEKGIFSLLKSIVY